MGRNVAGAAADVGDGMWAGGLRHDSQQGPVERLALQLRADLCRVALGDRVVTPPDVAHRSDHIEGCCHCTGENLRVADCVERQLASTPSRTPVRALARSLRPVMPIFE